MKQSARVKNKQPLAQERGCLLSSEPFQQSISLLSWAGFLSCGLFLTRRQLTMLSSETQISGQIWKAKQILLAFELSPRETPGWKKSHHKAFPPSSDSSKVWIQHFILFFGLVKVEVFSPPLDFTRSIMLPAILGTVFHILSWNLLPPLCTKQSHSNASPPSPPRSLLSREFAFPATRCGILPFLHISLCVPHGYLPCCIFHYRRRKPKPNWS